MLHFVQHDNCHTGFAQAETKSVKGGKVQKAVLLVIGVLGKNTHAGEIYVWW